MAPITRSRATGSLFNTKKRAVDYAEDGGSSDEVEEKAPKRKPTKRVKIAKDAYPAAKKPAAVGGRAKKRGRLNALPEMPLDILEEIFSFLDPGDLIRIARTTKAFRRLLLANQFSHLWRASYSRMEGYPPCPEDLPLLKWLQLLFGGPYCQVCAAPSIQRINFSIRARICKKCLRQSLVNVLSSRIEGIGSYLISEYVPIVQEGRDKYAYAQDLETLQTSIASALEGVDPSEAHHALSTVKASLRAAYAPRNAHRYECEAWQNRMLADRRDNLDERRTSRREEILRRLEAIGYTNSDAYMIWRLKDVSVSKPLTNRTWNTLLPTLLPTLDQARDQRRQRERRERRDRRVSTAMTAYIELLKTSAIKPQDIPYLPRPAEGIRFGTLPDLLDEDEDEISISDDWRQRLDAALSAALPLMHDAFKKHQAEFASLIEGSHDLQADPLSVLSLATSVFLVTDRYGDRTICFGLQAVAKSSVTNAYTGGAESYCDSRMSRIAQPTPPIAIKAVRIILRLMQLEETATILELDALDPCFTCMTCAAQYDPYYERHDGVLVGLRYRTAMNWRHAVQHLYDSGNPDDVQLHLLTANEREAVGAEGTLVALRRQRIANGIKAHSFACCYCADELVSLFNEGGYRYMTLEDVRVHAQSHDAEVAHEGVDFFMDPVGDRGVLGGFSATYSQVEEKAPESTADDAMA